MGLREFIRENRTEISESVARAYGENCRPTNDEERRDWILNDEAWYRMAQAAGCRI